MTYHVLKGLPPPWLQLEVRIVLFYMNREWCQVEPGYLIYIRLLSRIITFLC